MAKQFRADNIGSLLRPPELLQARAAYREGKLPREQLGDIEDRSILKALELQEAAGVEVFTDGEYRRDIFTADITQSVDGLVPGRTTVSFEWRGAGSELAGVKGRQSPVHRRRSTAQERPLHSGRGAVFETARAGTFQSLHAGRDPARDKPLQARGNR